MAEFLCGVHLIAIMNLIINLELQGQLYGYMGDHVKIDARMFLFITVNKPNLQKINFSLIFQNQSSMTNNNVSCSLLQFEHLC